MLTATVIGSVWATRRLTGLPSGAFLEVEVEAGNGQRGQRLVAFDVLGSGVGERVLVAQGSVAAATRGFGTFSTSRIRRPCPPQKSTTFITMLPSCANQLKR